MKIAGTYNFDASREAVWEALLDPTILQQVLPGCEKLEKTGDNAYEGALKIKVGPVQGLFQGKIALEDIEAPERYRLQIDGCGAPGFVKANAKVELKEVDGGGTLMEYDSDAQVGGRIASVGQRLLDSSAKAIVKQSLDGLEALVNARTAVADVTDDVSVTDEDGSEAAAPAVKPPPPAYKPPTQAEMARNVAKEVAKDLIPKPVLVGGVIALIAILFWVLL